MSGEETSKNPAESEPVGRGGASDKKSAFSDSFDAHTTRVAGDELPEDEPLTPELVEDEAIRGDFMLRWATVLLAVLMAFGRMNDTKPLVLIRSGDEMRANGFLPSGVDRFSHTMDGQPVVNVSWLFDHIVSLFWLVGGHAGLTLLKASVAGFSAWILVRISVPGVSTWWSSICALMAVVACSSDFWPLPELMSVLGMTLTMRLLFEHRLGIAKGLAWKLPLLMAIWCNLDARAWVGAGVVAAYATGLSLTNRIRLRRDATAAVVPGLGVVAVCCLLALLVNPFHINSLLSPITTYTVEYPAMQEQRGLGTPAAAASHDGRVDYYGILNPGAMILFDHAQIAGLAVLLTAIGMLLLSRSERDLSLWFCVMFVAALILLAAHELPAASIVAAVVAGVTAQEWYRRNFSMKYSVDSGELMFSRGGRAATVLAIAALGFLVVTSRLPGSVPLGLGFDDDTRMTMEAFAEQIKVLPEDAKILHTRIEQGDLLIWHGHRSFIDSRVTPFGRPSKPDSVSGLHQNLRRVLMAPPEPPPTNSDPEVKKEYESRLAKSREMAAESLQEFAITHAMVRTAPPGTPDFNSIVMLQASTDNRWFIVSLGAAVAILERATSATTQDDVTKRTPNLRKLAFGESEANPPGTRPIATPPTVYNKYVYRTRTSTSIDKRLATNYLFLSEQSPRNLSEVIDRVAAASLAIRHLNKSLAKQPDDAESFEMLARAYTQLSMMENIAAGGQMPARLKQLRYFQVISACRQALICDPDSLVAWNSLVIAYQQLGRFDLCRDALASWIRIAERGIEYQPDSAREEYENRRLALRELSSQVQSAEQEFEKAMQEQREQLKSAVRQNAGAPDAAANAEPGVPTPEELEQAQIALTEAGMANGGGLPKTALAILRKNQNLIQNTPYGLMLLGQLMLENGELNDATQVLPRLKVAAQASPDDFGLVDWQMAAGTLEIILCNYSGASALWAAQSVELTKKTEVPEYYAGFALSLPLVADVNVTVNAPVPLWPLRNTTELAGLVQRSTEMRSEVMLLSAIARLEEGDMKSASVLMKSILQDFGICPSTPIAATYLLMLDDTAQDFLARLQIPEGEEYLFPGETLPPAGAGAQGANGPPGSVPPGSVPAGSGTPGTGSPGAAQTPSGAAP